MRSTTFNGVYNEDPFNFEYFTSPILPYTLTVSQTPCLLWIRTSQSVLPEVFSFHVCMLDKGYSLFGLNLATDHDQVFEVSKRESVRIYLKFDVSLAHPVNVIVYAEYENVIQIDSARNVLLHYSN